MKKSHLTLKKIEIAGYKSICSEGESIYFGDITLLLGANGSGKSNLVSFFRLLKTFDKKELQKFIAKQGSASSLLFYGSKVTGLTRKKWSSFVLYKSSVIQLFHEYMRL